MYITNRLMIPLCTTLRVGVTTNSVKLPCAFCMYMYETCRNIPEKYQIRPVSMQALSAEGQLWESEEKSC